MSKIDKLRKAQEKKGLRPPATEPPPSGTVQAFTGPVPNGLKPKKRRPYASAMVRDGRAKFRYPNATLVMKVFMDEKWTCLLKIGSGPHEGKQFIATAEGSFGAEEQLGRMWIEFLQEQEGK
jgi:hypothetical protein